MVTSSSSDVSASIKSTVARASKTFRSVPSSSIARIMFAFSSTFAHVAWTALASSRSFLFSFFWALPAAEVSSGVAMAVNALVASTATLTDVDDCRRSNCSKIWAAALRPGANNSSLAFCLRFGLAVILIMLQSVLSSSSLSSASFSINPSIRLGTISNNSATTGSSLNLKPRWHFWTTRFSKACCRAWRSSVRGSVKNSRILGKSGRSSAAKPWPAIGPSMGLPLCFARGGVPTRFDCGACRSWLLLGARGCDSWPSPASWQRLRAAL
mmetsp:Transcript_20156/g.57209  ORF Transcript_20156/g.57209 Transcript_20156/m.57209 type:complete len:269 (-) Transcript_20156:13-819(-)